MAPKFYNVLQGRTTATPPPLPPSRISQIFHTLRCALPNFASDSVRYTIDAFLRACAARKTFRPAPIRFRASIPPKQIISNHELSMDPMWLKSAHILHVINTHKHYENATIPRGKHAPIFGTHLSSTGPLIHRFTAIVHCYQEISFRTSQFRDLATQEYMELQFSLVLSHNAVGLENDTTLLFGTYSSSCAIVTLLSSPNVSAWRFRA